MSDFPIIKLTDIGIKMSEAGIDQSPSRNVMDDICEDCGARFGEHFVGGPRHPRPLLPEAAVRKVAWDAYVAECRVYNREVAFHRALDRVRVEMTEKIKKLEENLIPTTV